LLNITAQKNAAGAKSYFAVSDYYSEGQEIVGDWGGKGAVLLGLFGQVDKPQFDQLCDNINPATGKQLTALTRDGRRVGYDFTWSAPKSVSVVQALTGDERITAAFRDSISDTMKEMEAEMHTRVRKGGRDEDRETRNLTWAEFIHLTSRPVNGVPCPQLHAHVFCFNATYDAVEDQWKAGQFGNIKQDAFYWQAVQQARFAGCLQDLGYGIRRTKDAFEIAGVPDPVLKKFSLRTALIERAAMALGITTAASKAKLAATTREAKNDALPYSRLKELWAERLDDAEAAAIGNLPPVGERMPAAEADQYQARFAVEHSFERASVVDERRLLTLALRHGCGEVTPEGVRAEADRCGLLKRREYGKTWATTKEVLAEERGMIAFAVSGRGTVRPLSTQTGPSRATQATSAGVTLSAEQQAAVGHVLGSPDKVVLLRGAAGTGKTTLTREAVRQIEAAGKPVVMLAPSAQASRGVLRDEGFAAADTLARFLVDERLQQSAKDGVIWLDEAGLVGSKTMASLFRAAESLNARVVLAGDKRQLASVERGHALRVLEDIAGLPCAEVKDIRRQKGEYREAVKLLSRGDAAAGFAKLDQMGCVKELDGYGAAVQEYVAAVKSGETVLIVCPTHAEGDRITGEVRDELKRQGLLRDDQRSFERLIPTQWTEAERGDASAYHGDELLQFHRNAGRYKAGERIDANDVVGNFEAMRGCFAAYRRSSLTLATGDLIRVTANGKTSGSGKHRLNNGSQYEVAGFTRSGDVKLTNGWIIDKGFGHLASAYVSTSHAAQGRTVDRVLVVASAASYPAVTRENFYVAASRAKKGISVWTDDKQELAERVGRSDARMSATELVGTLPVPHLNRVRQAIRRARTAAVVAVKTAAREIQHAIQPTEHAYDR
jgi:conjugative relaxase-like TrwC/TraI family protein